ncbi:hypothetical protein [Pseudoxanthomonas sp. GM95]|uniref:hypothetical protein n=1 Tax=Pseudoxanthomonas sp. GM95 TaxID=1881043 RepID=UPI001113EDB4|nr:hypothetical protein [Pseudoxanthomonas sp. GM95]
MSADQSLSMPRRADHAGAWLWLIPAFASLLYPWILASAQQQFHAHHAGAGAALLLASALPTVLAIACAAVMARKLLLTPIRRLGLELCCLYAATPPAFTLLGVLLYLMRIDGIDDATWTGAWSALTAYGALRMATHETGAPRILLTDRPRSLLPALHGISALLLLTLFLGPHIVNHLLGLLGEDVHRDVMTWLRHFYRNAAVQPALVAVFGFQVISGLVLLCQPQSQPISPFQVLQRASGLYLAVFIPAHLNSVFNLARRNGVETDYAWATGQPAGLLDDAWNIRLVPHYALAILLLAIHLACAVRVVLMAHGVRERTANGWAWILMLAGGVLDAAVLAGMLGMRL